MTSTPSGLPNSMQPEGRASPDLSPPVAGVLDSEERSSSVGSEASVPVVGMCCSAGGVTALQGFFAQMPADSGAAFVVIPHLAPNEETQMVAVLACQTKMLVQEAQPGMVIQANRVYVVPNGQNLALSNGHLQLTKQPAEQRFGITIDIFLRSLATDRRERAIAVILSGSSGNGSSGLKELKASGGMIMVQAPATAEFHQMPEAAIATGVVDFVLPVAEMPRTLIRYLQHPYPNGRIDHPSDQANLSILNRILALLKARTKYDFRGYQKNTLSRRIWRRMGLFHILRMSDYLVYLHEHPDEPHALSGDLLIGVTDFFRDPEAYQVLQQRVIPEIVSNYLRRATQQDASATRQSPIRVWIAGCSTGEEAYSVAILLHEQFMRQDCLPDLQIFGTDVDEQALRIARQGIYDESSIANVSPERLQRFFTQLDSHHWQIRKQVRSTIIFASQNLITDAPFSELHLICCRNVLIYLEHPVQSKIQHSFRFGLSDEGFLFLGSAESLDDSSSEFETISQKWRIFRLIRKEQACRVEVPSSAILEPLLLHPRVAEDHVRPEPSSEEVLKRLVLEDFAPAAALITHDFEIVSVVGPMTNYLEFPPGRLSQDILMMARPGLRTHIKTAVQKVRKTGRPVIDAEALVRRDGAYIPCSMTARPAPDSESDTGLVLIAFRDVVTDSHKSAGAEAVQTPETAPMLSRFTEDELLSTQEDLRATIEQLQSANEELRTSNEEIMSINEEARSANEELETSREELQAVNEELGAVNRELQNKCEALDQTNSDLTNLISSTDLATVFLDPELRIKRFTPSVVELLNLRPTDLQRPLTDLVSNVFDPDLFADSRAVLEKLVPIEKVVWSRSSKSMQQARGEASDSSQIAGSEAARLVEVTRNHGPSHCYVRRILPYRATDDRIGGVVITFVDITQQLMAQVQQRRLSAVLWASHDAITLHDFDGRILAWNRTAEQIYGYGESEALTMNVRQLLPERRVAEMLAYTERVRRDETVVPFQTQRLSKQSVEFDVEVNIAAYRNESGTPIGVIATERDVTDRKRADTALRDSEERFRAVVNTALDAIVTIDKQGTIVFHNPATERMFGYQGNELLGKNVKMLMPAPFKEEHDKYLERFLKTGEARIMGHGRDLTALRKDGTTLSVNLLVSQVEHMGLFTGMIRDISQSKTLQRQVLEIATDEQRRIGQELHDGIGQELTGLGLFAATLVDLLERGPRNDEPGQDEWQLTGVDLKRLRETSAKLSAKLLECNQHVQQLSHGIIPSQIAAEGLQAALEELARVTDGQRNIACHLICESPIYPANSSQATQLYRIAQEAVNNAVKHSQATEIQIVASQTDEALCLEIRDNGVGFDPYSFARVTRPAVSQGFGLEIMQYRAGMMGGTLTASPREQGGVLIKCLVPNPRIQSDRSPAS